jgi:DNA-binding NtrC family response regulator
MTGSFCVLAADDQPAVREALRILLTNAGYRVELATSPREVLRLIKEQEFALALLDLNYARDTTSGEEGLELIQQLQKIEGAPPALVMTAWATVDLAVAAMRSGVRDFIQKPWDNARVLSIIQTQLQVEPRRDELIDWRRKTNSCGRKSPVRLGQTCWALPKR